jgi:hypothetical protein
MVIPLIYIPSQRTKRDQASIFYHAMYMFYETKLYFYVVFWSMEPIVGGTILHLHKLVWMHEICPRCIVE